MRPARRRERILAALLGAALAAPGGAAPPDDVSLGAGGPLRLSLEPSRLVLGRDAAADLRIATSPDVEDVTVTASAGRVDALRRVPGGFVARYRPPADRIPQVAIVAALGRTPRGTEHGWVAVPLSGQGDARVRTRPGQEITLHIGERSFGPRRAGEDGIAVIPVVVPPGVREAHHGFRPIDLHVPETPLLYAVAERGTVLADRPERVRVVAFVVAPHGAARRGDVPVFEPSRGSVAVVEKEPGAVEAIWTLPPGRAGEERLAVRLPSAAASRSLVKLETVAGPPAVVAVTFDREVLAADDPVPVYVTARALDAAGNPVPAVLALSVDGGELADVHDHDASEVQGRIRAGPAFGGRSDLRVTAVAGGVGISGARALPLRPGEPAAARFAGVRSALRGDGSAQSLRVEVTDRHGNPVSTPPVVTAERGQVLSVAATEPGAFEVRYVPPAVADPTPERLVATLGAARATAEPLLLGPAPGRTVEVRGGALADVRARFAAPQLGFAAEHRAAWEPPFAATVDAAWRAELEVTDFTAATAVTLLGGASLSRAAGAAATLRAGATAGLLMGGAGTAPAARLSAGATFARSGFVPFVEASLLAAGRGTPGAFAAVGLSVGVRLTLENKHGDDPHRR